MSEVIPNSCFFLSGQTELMVLCVPARLCACEGGANEPSTKLHEIRLLIEMRATVIVLRSCM